MPKKGYKPTKEHKSKVSLALKGKFKSISLIERFGVEKTKQRLEKFRKTRLGYKHLEETKKKISVANKGNKLGTWEKRYGKEYSTHRKLYHAKIMSKTMKGTLIERFGVEKANQITKKHKKKRAFQIVPLQDTLIEIKIQNFLKNLNINFYTHQYRNEIQHSYQCDIFIPLYNLIIECDGNYWHNYPCGNDIDKIRTNELLEKGFKVLRLWEKDIKNMSLEQFNNILQKEVIINDIK